MLLLFSTGMFVLSALGFCFSAGKYGAYLLACYEPDREEYQSVCKIGTGFTDDILHSFWEDLKEHTVEKRPRCEESRTYFLVRFAPSFLDFSRGLHISFRLLRAIQSVKGVISLPVEVKFCLLSGVRSAHVLR